MPEDIIEVINRANSSDNKIQAIHFNNNQAIVQNDHSNNHNKNGRIHINHTNNPEDERHDELNSSPQLYGMEPNKIVNKKQKILLTVRPSKSTSISVKNNGTTNTGTFLHGLFFMCIYETVIAILCLHLSLTVYMHKNILYHLYRGIPTVVYLLLSLLVSLRKGILRPFLFASLQSKFLQSSLLASLRNGSLRSSLLTSLPSLLVYIRNRVLQSSLLVSLQSDFVCASPMTSI